MIHLKNLAQKIGTTNDGGFSLIELLVSMAVASIVIAGIYTAYRTQVGTYMGQEDVVEMQQNVRNGMYYMQRSVRMSGFDPQRTGLMGFVISFNAPFDALGATTDAANIAFTTDISENGDLDSNDAELIAYRLNANQLQKIAITAAFPTGTWETVAENIDALNFVYLRGDGSPIPTVTPLDAADLADIRSVQITIVARAGQNPSPLAAKVTDNNIYANQQGTEIFNPAGDNFRRIILTAQANCRNLGL